tara:strand:+ start:35 stop:1207 length:1173 start_codon:yes stop_codon:yes gene_type:complete
LGFLQNKTIVITSNEPWGDIWYTKHNYAAELSKKNKVYFVNPPNSWKIGIRQGYGIKENIITDNLSVLSYNNYLPLINTLKGGTNDPIYFNKINDWLISKSLNRHLKKNGHKSFYLWSFDPQRIYSPNQLNTDFSLFHCADHQWVNTFGTHRLCNQGNALFLTSKHLFHEYDIFELPKHHVPHGISSDQFDVSLEDAMQVEIPVNDFGLFIGVIDGRVDYALLEKALIKFPNQNFVFVGPLKENHIFEESFQLFEKLFKVKPYKNLIHLGPKHFKSLRYYIRRAKFCISFMDPKWPGNTIGHHKTLVYLAQGKAVFQYLFKDYVGCEDFIYMSTNHEDSLNQLDIFLKEGEVEKLHQKRIEYASKSRFDNLINSIEKYLETTFPDLKGTK